MAEDEAYRKLLLKQGYGLIGRHSAAKICTWTKKSLRGEGVCYKERFYGIRSHMCCQITPSMGYCQNRCVICWRDLSKTYGTEMVDDGTLDEPKDIIKGAVREQRRLLNGFKGFEGADLEKFEASKNPKNFAISLSGEPLSYPKLNKLIRELHAQGNSTFVVSNGMLPDALEKLERPTQLYLSLDAYDEENLKKIDRSLFSDAWQRLMRSFDIMSSLKDWRTAVRVTLIKGWNMEHPEKYAALLERANPRFVEVKAYMFVGSSRTRLELENMPYHHEVKAFAEKICKHCGYKFIDEQEESRVVLLMKEDRPDRIMKF